MNGLLNGKRIVVTGAARGLGYHFAEACAAQGATVVMCDILQGELAESAHRLRQKGYQVESHAIDLASQASIEQVFSAIGAQGSIDGLVNNAAILHRRRRKKYDRLRSGSVGSGNDGQR